MLRLSLSAMAAFVIFIIGHFLHFHFANPYDRVASLLIGAVLGLVVYVGIFKMMPGEPVLERIIVRGNRLLIRLLPVLIGALFYGFLVLGYLEFYFTADRSVSFRMLRITASQPGGSIKADEMLAKYDTRAIILRRMEDLAYGGYYNKEGNRYSLTIKGHFILAIYDVTTDFLHMPTF